MVKLNKIKGLMAENGDTQQTLAEKLKVTKQLVNLKLTGKSPLSLEMLTEIAHIYGVTVAELIE